MKILICGMGYVGSSVAQAAHDAGHIVTGFDSDSNKVKDLSGKFPFEICDSIPLKLDPDIAIISVPTPLNIERKPDLSHLENVCEQLRRNLTRPTLIINESTSFPGTLRDFIAPRIGEVHRYATAPERVDPDNSQWGPRNTPRVLGALDDEALEQAQTFYESFCHTVITVSSPEVAEISKLFENSFRQVNIALVQEFSRVCNSMDISTWEALDAASTKPFGFMRFTPSVGVGGHCIPVDPLYLQRVAEEKGVDTPLILNADQTNESQAEFCVQVLESKVGSLEGIHIQVAGISYKPNVSDLRESKTLNFIQLMRAKGARVEWHDPLVGTWNDEYSTELGKADIGIIAAPHKVIDFAPWINAKVNVFDVSPGPVIPGARKLL